LTAIAPSGRQTDSRETRFLVSSCCYVCLKLSVNVEHARVNKQPSHLYDCPSVTHCLPRQRYRARPRRIKVYPTVYLSTNLTSAEGREALGGAARERGTRERAPITYSANPTYILDTANLTSPPARAMITIEPAGGPTRSNSSCISVLQRETRGFFRFS